MAFRNAIVYPGQHEAAARGLSDIVSSIYTWLCTPKGDVPAVSGERAQQNRPAARTAAKRRSGEHRTRVLKRSFGNWKQAVASIRRARVFQEVFKSTTPAAQMVPDAPPSPEGPPVPVDPTPEPWPAEVELPKPSIWSGFSWLLDFGDREAATRLVQEVYSADVDGIGGVSRTKYTLGFVGEIKARIFGTQPCRHRAARRIFLTILPTLRVMLDDLRADNSMAVLADTSPAGVQYVETAVRRLIREKVDSKAIRPEQRALYQRLLVRLAPLITDEEEFAMEVAKVVGAGPGY